MNYKDYTLEIGLSIGLIIGPFILIAWIKALKLWIELLGL